MMSRAAMLSEDEAQEQGDESMVLFRRAAILRRDVRQRFISLLPCAFLSLTKDHVQPSLSSATKPSAQQGSPFIC